MSEAQQSGAEMAGRKDTAPVGSGKVPRGDGICAEFASREKGRGGEAGGETGEYGYTQPESIEMRRLGEANDMI